MWTRRGPWWCSSSTENDPNSPLYGESIQYISPSSITLGGEFESSIYLGSGLSLYLNGTRGKATYVGTLTAYSPDGSTKNPLVVKAPSGLWVSGTPTDTETEALTYQEKGWNAGIFNKRIGSKFLNAGPGFGGSCFPKDTLALMRTAKDVGSPVRLIETTVAVNDARKAAMADKVAALHVLYAILAALVASARGQAGPIRIEAPMFEVMTSFLLNEHLAGATFAGDGEVGYPCLLSPDRRPHRTADGWIAVLPYTKDQWQRFLGEIDRAELCEEEWFRNPNTRQAHIGELYRLVSASLVERTTDAWIDTLSTLDIPCSRIATPAELLDDPHLTEVDFFKVPEGYPEGIVRSLPQPVLFDGIAPLPDIAPRALGADSRAILADCGYDDAAIEALIDAGVIRAGGEG